MRLIDKDALKVKAEHIIGINGSSDAWHILSEIDHAEEIDAVKVVRCADCKHCQVDTLYHNYWCDGQSVWADHYCSKGEMRH